MRICPRCGVRREASMPMRQPPPEPIPAPAAPEPYRANFEVPVVPTSKSMGRIGGVGYSTPTRNTVLLSPQDAQRRFPLFTAAQWTLITIGAGLLVMMIVIAYLLWRQQHLDTTQPANRNVVAVQPSPTATTTPQPSPTPTPSDDQAIYESVKTQL